MENTPHPRSFLSHSSKDKEFVRSVANRLGRQICTFDEQSFESAQDLRKAIFDTISTCTIFVIFASSHSVHSDWCDLEIDEAWSRLISKHIKKVITILIDSEITHANLPMWLQKSLIRSALSAADVASEIRHHLHTTILADKPSSDRFLGRSSELSQLENLLIPAGIMSSPRVFIVQGLEGVGRRSLVRRVAQGTLRLNRLVEIPVEEGDSEAELALKIASHAEPYNTHSGLERIGREILQLSPSESVKRFLTNARALTANNELVTLIDRGGLCTDDGFFSEPIRLILSNITSDDDCYIFIASRRLPRQDPGVAFPTLRLGGLPDTDMARLLKLCCDDLGVSLRPADINGITGFLGGYPPAAHYAAQEIQAYGIDLMLRDKHSLVKFRTAVFLSHLKRKAPDAVWLTALRLLATQSPLPYSAVTAGITAFMPEATEQAIAATVRDLIDRSIAETTAGGLYSIASPVADVAGAVFGLLTDQGVWESVFSALNAHINEANRDDVNLEVLRVQYRAAQLAGVSQNTQALTNLVNDTIRIADAYFNDRNYPRALEFCRRALEERPRNTKVLSLNIRCLAHLDQWDLAFDQVAVYRRYSAAKDALFLEGFVLRKKGQHQDAISRYKEALSLGRDDMSIQRELAQCYMAENDLATAKIHIDSARAKGASNPHIIDLWVKIALALRNWDDAEQGLAVLERVDTPARFFHRRASLELQRNRLDRAEEYAQKACAARSKPSFEELVQLAKVQILLERTDAAEATIHRIEEIHRGVRKGVIAGMKCWLLNTQRRYADALALSDMMDEKNGPHFDNVRRHALDGLLKSASISDDLRERYKHERAKIGTGGDFKAEMLNYAQSLDSRLLQTD